MTSMIIDWQPETGLWRMIIDWQPETGLWRMPFDQSSLRCLLLPLCIG
jgi:hypothetical protein